MHLAKWKGAALAFFVLVPLGILLLQPLPSQPPVPSPTKGTNAEQRQSNRVDNSGSNEQQQPSAISSSSASSLDGTHPADHPNKREHESANQWGMLFFTGVLALAAMAQIFVYLRQAHYMQRGLHIAMRQTRIANTNALAAKKSVGIAGAQVGAALDQVKISELAMIAGNRAYVHHFGIRWFSHRETEGERVNQIFWRIRPQWTNTGNTPTRRLRVCINYALVNAPLPADFNYPLDQTREPVPATIAPKGAIESTHRDIFSDELIEVRDGRKYFFVWGAAIYHDVFPDTPERVTKFCVMAGPISGDLQRHWHAIDNPVEIRFLTYGPHNCADEDCTVPNGH